MRGYRKAPPVDVILSLHKAGLSNSQIAERFGCGRETIAGIVRKAKKAGEIPAPEANAVPIRKPLREDERKVIKVIDGAFISVPRIPSIHGAYDAT